MNRRLFTSNVSPDLKMVADNLVSPIALDAPPDGSKRLFVVDQVGKIRVIDANGTRSGTPFLDITSKMVVPNPVPAGTIPYASRNSKWRRMVRQLTRRPSGS